jgi:hypothetical protein
MILIRNSLTIRIVTLKNYFVSRSVNAVNPSSRYIELDIVLVI